MVTSSNRIINDRSNIIKNYVCAIGASLVVTMFDGMRNGDSAALKKASLWFSDSFGTGSPGILWSIAALTFFGVTSALMVLAYKPRSNKESFLLGIGVLAVLYSTITPPQPRKVTSLSIDKQQGFSIIPSAYAQPNRQSESTTTDVWFIVEGAYRSLTPFVSVSVYPADRSRSVYRYTISAIDMIRLPEGKYHFELSLADYRSIIFTADIAGAAVGFSQIALTSVPFESFLNTLGPLRVKPWQDMQLGEALSQAQALCSINEKKAALSALTKIRPLERSTLNVLYGAKERLCLNN